MNRTRMGWVAAVSVRYLRGDITKTEMRLALRWGGTWRDALHIYLPYLAGVLLAMAVHWITH